jgi:hypothetical protein
MKKSPELLAKSPHVENNTYKNPCVKTAICYLRVSKTVDKRPQLRNCPAEGNWTTARCGRATFLWGGSIAAMPSNGRKTNCLAKGLITEPMNHNHQTCQNSCSKKNISISIIKEQYWLVVEPPL